MRRVGLGLVVAAVLSAAGLVAVVRADEQEVPLDKVPAAVTDAVKKRFPGAELTAAVKDTKKGETVYTITVKHKGSQYDATVAGSGQLKQIEKEIPIKDLPAAVTDAVEAKFPKASIRRAEELVKVADGKEQMTGYTVGLAQGSKKWEVVVSSDGKKISEPED